MQSFAQNILNLDISDQLLTMVNQAETYARERVYTAEEELEGAVKFIAYCVVAVVRVMSKFAIKGKTLL